MEQTPEAARFVIPYTLEKHEALFVDDSALYLAIESIGALVGFIIFILDSDGISIELRRIVVSTRDKGVGQRALQLAEDFCRTNFDRSRIWLDVFEDNQRGRYIYQKLGYVQFSKKPYEGRQLLFLRNHCRAT